MKFRTAKGAGSDLFGRHLDHLVEHTYGGVATRRAAAVECHPDAALLVNRQAVGTTGLGWDLCERTPPSQSGFAVVVEDVDALGWCIVVVGARAVRAPLEPVRDRDTFQNNVHGELGIQPV